jgi:hypothetical protein
MPLMPSKFSRPWPFQIAAQKLHPVNKPDYAAYISALEALDADTPCLSVFLDDPSGAAMAKAYADMLKHVRQHWYADGDGSFWPDLPNRNRIQRQAWLQLLRTLQANPRPVSIFWLCEHQIQRSFQIAISEEPLQVTAIVLTPFVNYTELPEMEAVSEDIWVFSDEAGADEILRESAEQGLNEPSKNTKTCQDLGQGVWMTEVHSVAPI